MYTLFLSRRKMRVTAVLGFALVLILILVTAVVWLRNSFYRPNSNLVILGANDLGMHCIQPDYSQFLILPPGNNLVVQIFRNTPETELVTEGIRVEYEINLQNDPTLYSNFWQYAARYGYDVPPGTGITGSLLKGTMTLDPTKRFWTATAIPVTSQTAGTGPASPYQTATITVFDRISHELLAEFDKLVVPVSPEMDCLKCHQTWAGILQAHDEEEKTDLFRDSLAGVLHRCNECHADPILAQPGLPGLPSLSLAMHGFHADKMDSAVNPVCYNCHPGLITDCNRGVMKANGLDCEDCHGTMAQVAASIQAGRTPWLQEPGCEKCHGATYQVNPGQLYRRSFLQNGPDEEMNGKILCAVCHNAPHAEWLSLLKLDNLLPKRYQGKGTFIYQCAVCHRDQAGTEVHQRN